MIFNVCGLTDKKTYPGVEYYLRVNPSAGALYPNELYFQARGIEGIEDGIYHYENSTNQITLLSSIDDKGLEGYLSDKREIQGFVFLISSVYYRSSWKYKNRAFRYCLLDAGHLLGSLEASSYINSTSSLIDYRIEHQALNRCFGFNNEEFFMAAAIVGEAQSKRVEPINLELPYVNASHFFEKNDLIEQAYEKSLEITSCKAQETQPVFNYQKEYFKEVVFNRRSIREFREEAMSKESFFKILEILNEPILSNCDEKVNIYCVINRVIGMPLGLYYNDQYIKEGDFKHKAGYLCLEQALGMQSAVTFFLTTSSKNYQASYMKAGIIGHRLYLAANYLSYGCSGIGAYYDDEVNEFVNNDEMVLYALAIGN